ncbi:DUF2325 domain-containing protein [Azospirillum soli]|uniref:DUF2325 domain-containing protein n=1 Tax=Azospirillum soli TaxID=1304799 RepID=UPI002484926F|nr:DUF2325 domain-containing protein [Azospirillum soli]MBP2315731.1 hypothetical protein [Azospirillum soli]
MCERCRTTQADPPPTAGRRRKLWAIPPEFHCSIVGTCLSSDDIAWLCRRLALVPSSDARPYDIHRFFVERAGTDGREARLMHKRMDEAFAGAIRRFARESSEDGWLALWEHSVATGAVAAAYWAVLSHAGIPDAIRARAFADVHMLSHIMGGESRRHLRDAQEQARRCAELEARLARQERSSAERLAEKDARIQSLEAQLAERRPPAAASPAASEPKPRRVGRLLREVGALRRRVTVERMRARLAEAELDKLRHLIDGVDRLVPPPSGESAKPTASADLGGQAILYVGGRPSALPRLRAAVETRNGCLLHHDGGFEQAARCLEGLVERADVVVCPVDCVSHDACLRVKGLCRRMGKPFVPMRSAGATSFARILGSLGQAGASSPPTAGH